MKGFARSLVVKQRQKIKEFGNGLLANFLHETCLQGIMVVVLIIFVFMNINIMISCKHVTSQGFSHCWFVNGKCTNVSIACWDLITSYCLLRSKLLAIWHFYTVSQKNHTCSFQFLIASKAELIFSDKSHISAINSDLLMVAQWPFADKL